MKFLWVSDLHLDYVPIVDFATKVANSIALSDCNAIMITGDISNSNFIIEHLSLLEKVVKRPIYFVLGNHDYYHGNISKVRNEVKQLSLKSKYLKYLPLSNYHLLNEECAIVGHDTWYDCRNGDVNRTQLRMNDWVLISDFKDAVYRSKRNPLESIISLSKQLAFDGAKHISNGINLAVSENKKLKRISVVTHFPPFAETSCFRGYQGNIGALPFYSSKVIGETIKTAAKNNPNIKFSVFSGHTHHKCYYSISKNINSYVSTICDEMPLKHDIVLM